MKIKILLASVLILAGLVVVIPQVVRQIQVKLSGYEEVPAVSTGAGGELRARIINEPNEYTPISSETKIQYQLNYFALEGNVTQAHIHLGQSGVNGGVSVWLCANPSALPTGTVIPAGTQPCPAPPAQIEGTITAANVIGPAAQGIAPGEFNELLRALRAGKTYVNVHSTKFPGGEVRSQINTESESEHNQNGIQNGTSPSAHSH